MPQASANAERTRGVGEEVAGLKAGEDLREDEEFAIPVTGCPEVAEARVEGFVELKL